MSVAFQSSPDAIGLISWKEFSQNDGNYYSSESNRMIALSTLAILILISSVMIVRRKGY